MANLATDSSPCFGYTKAMSNKPKFATTPAGTTNEWVRAALTHWGRSAPVLAAELTKRGLGSYDRSTIYKMTVKRKVTKEEAEAIAEITGFPLRPLDEVDDMHRRFATLSEHHRRLIRQMMDALEAEKRSVGQ